MSEEVKSPLQAILQASAGEGAQSAEGDAAAAVVTETETTEDDGGDGGGAAKPAETETSETQEVQIPEGYIKADEYETLKADLERINSDPYLKELFELRKKGTAITPDLLKSGFEDYSAAKYNVDDIDNAVKLAAQSLVEGGYSERAASAAIKKKFPELFDQSVDTDSDEYELAVQEVKNAAKQYINQKKESQLKLREIQASPTNKEDVIREYEQTQQQVLAQQGEAIKKAAEDLLGKHAKVGFELPFTSDHTGELNLKVDVEITKEMKAQLKKDMQNPNIALSVYQSIDRAASPESQEAEIMRKFMLYRYPEKVRQLEISQAVESAIKNFISGKIKAPSNKPAPGAGTQEAGKIVVDKRAPLASVFQQIYQES